MVKATSKKTETTTTTTTTTKSKPLPKIAIVAIGCVGLLVIVSIILGVAGKMLFSKMGLGFLKKGIESQTGLSIDEKGNGMTFKDEKTGSVVSIGEQTTIPQDFPKDVPLYPGATAISNASGAESGKAKGYWLMLNSKDVASKVTAFYETELPKNGWVVENTFTISESSTWQANKGALTLAVIVGGSNDNEGTSILLTVSPTETTEE